MRLVCTGEPEHLINYTSHSYSDVFKSAITQVCLLVVNEEIQSTWNHEGKIKFSMKKGNDFKDSFGTQHLEFQKCAPFLLMLISSKIVVNPKEAKRNKLKTTESMIPSMMNAVGSLLYCINRSMDANALLNTLTLQ